jgi:antirestriction protein
MMNVYVENLAKYNEGELDSGDWITLPMNSIDLQEAIEAILGDDEEYAIHDFESDLTYEVGRYDDIFSLNDTLEAIENADIELLNAIMSVTGEDVEGAYAIIQDGDYMMLHSVNSEEDLGYEFLEMTGEYHQMSETIQRYFDFAKFGRDLTFDGWHIVGNGTAICINN